MFKSAPWAPMLAKEVVVQDARRSFIALRYDL
jgi:hypothetical protein